MANSASPVRVRIRISRSILTFLGSILLAAGVAVGAEKAAVARIVDCRMPVSIYATKPTAASIGLELHKNDTIVVSHGGSVTLVFEDGVLQKFEGPTLVTVTSSNRGKEGTISKLASGLADLIFPGKKESEKARLAVRSPVPSEESALTLPVLTFPPSATAMLNPPDRLVWQPIEGTAIYTVTLSDQNHVLWREQTQNADISIPSDSLDLHPGGCYFWTVEAGIGHTPLQSEQSTFEVVDTTSQNQIKRAVDEINALGLQPRLSALLRVNLYQNHNLVVEEYQEVEAFLKKWPGDYIGLLTKAQLCETMNLYREAVTCYHKALQQ